MPHGNPQLKQARIEELQTKLATLKDLLADRTMERDNAEVGATALKEKLAVAEGLLQILLMEAITDNAMSKETYERAKDYLSGSPTECPDCAIGN